MPKNYRYIFEENRKSEKIWFTATAIFPEDISRFPYAPYLKLFYGKCPVILTKNLCHTNSLTLGILTKIRRMLYATVRY